MALMGWQDAGMVRRYGKANEAERALEAARRLEGGRPVSRHLVAMPITGGLVECGQPSRRRTLPGAWRVTGESEKPWPLIGPAEQHERAFGPRGAAREGGCLACGERASQG